MKLWLTLLVVVLTCTIGAQAFDLHYGEKCNDTSDCTESLDCIYGACSCRTGEGYEYDQVRQSCVGRVGAACDTQDDCIASATCTDLFCTCRDGYSSTRDRHCAKNFDESCNAQAVCNGDLLLECSEEGQRCRCQNETQHLYDEEMGFCGALVGRPCDPYTDSSGFPNGKTGKKCYSGSVCERNSSDPNRAYVCQCPEGSHVTIDKICASDNSGVRAVVASSVAIMGCVMFSLAQ